MRIKYCMGCKTEPAVIGGFCNECHKKHCSKCGRVSVHNTRWDDKGKPYCPACFKKLIQFATQVEGKTELPTLENRLTKIEARLDRIENHILGRQPSASIQTPGPEINIESRIDSLLDTMDVPSPSVDDIKNRALKIMMESDEFTRESESESESDTTSDKD